MIAKAKAAREKAAADKVPHAAPHSPRPQRFSLRRGADTLRVAKAAAESDDKAAEALAAFQLLHKKAMAAGPDTVPRGARHSPIAFLTAMRC